MGGWAYLLARGRLSDFGRLLLCSVIVSSAAAPLALGYPPNLLSPGMTYNSYGYCFVALILLESFIPSKTTRRRSALFGGASTGVILAILIFLKITFFVGAAVLFIALAAVRPQTKQRWAGLLCGFSTAAMLFIAYMRFELRPMWDDLAILAGAKRFRPDYYQIGSILESAVLLLIFSVSVALFLHGKGEKKEALAIFLAAPAVCATGLVLIFTSFEPNGFPLQAVLPILIVDLLNRRAVLGSSPDRAFHLSLLLWGTLMVITMLVPDALSLSYGFVQKIRLDHRYAPMQSPVLGQFACVKEDQAYGTWVNDGLALLKSYKRPGDTVMSLDFSNPFSYALSMKPARGGAIALQYETTFNDTYRPTPEWLFGHASLVMVPREFFEDNSRDSIPRLYGPYLNAHFHFVSESALWRLYRNNATPKFDK